MVIFLNFFLSSISTPPTFLLVSAITFTVSCVLQLMRLTYKAGSLTWLKMKNVLSINLWKNSWSSMPKFPGKIYCHILATHNGRHFLALAEVQTIVQPMIFCVCEYCFSRSHAREQLHSSRREEAKEKRVARQKQKSPRITSPMVQKPCEYSFGRCGLQDNLFPKSIVIGSKHGSALWMHCKKLMVVCFVTA